MKKISSALFVLALFALSACTAPPLTANDRATEMANPASTHCVEQGYELEVRAEEGGDVGYCVFPDGSECEEWALFRGECEAPGVIGMPNPASKYCEDEGYTLEIRSEEGGAVGYCVFDDGSECEEWAFFRDECAPGQ